MTDSTTGDLEQRVARAICKSKGINPDMCVAGSGGTPDTLSICYQYAWELESPCAQAALKAHAEWLEEQGLVVMNENVVLAAAAVVKERNEELAAAQQEDRHND